MQNEEEGTYTDNVSPHGARVLSRWFGNLVETSASHTVKEDLRFRKGDLLPEDRRTTLFCTR